MSEFKFDDEIEASDNEDFRGWRPVRFLADAKHCSNYVNKGGSEKHIVALSLDGKAYACRYARPATPRILIDGINYPCSKMQAARIAEIKKELDVQYKIITGEV
tara:strand:+ start:151 stop:462 length:312 start_codon:yes stop_codon:yes gene_type:complete